MNTDIIATTTSPIDTNNNIEKIDKTQYTHKTIRLEYTPPPMPQETRDFITRALAVPPNVPTSRYEMSNDTKALLDIILHIARLQYEGVIGDGNVVYK